MKKNIGPTDAWIRSLLGLELLFAGLFLFGGFAFPEGTLAVMIALMLMITALLEYSPVYALLKINTRDRKPVPVLGESEQWEGVRRDFPALMKGGGLKMSEHLMRLYQADWCPFAQRVRRRLDELGIAYIPVDVPRDKAMREDLFRISGQRGVPTLVDGDVVIADDDDAIIAYVEGKHHKGKCNA